MKPADRREQERLATRTAILDATEQIMREEGYAAVTSRRVAEKAGLKSQLVHYHFGTMDDLFQEAFRRNDARFFARHTRSVASPDPLDEIWRLSTSQEGMDLVSEYLSVANHRKVLQQDLIQTWSRFRSLHTTVIAKHYEDGRIDPGQLTPGVMAFLITAIGSTLVNEAGIGFTEGHVEIVAFMESLLKTLQGNAEAKPASTTARSVQVTPGRAA